jgi:hypothetical protein
MTIRPPRTIAAGLNVACSSHRTVLSFTGERKVDVARGTSTGLGGAGLLEWSEHPVAARLCAERAREPSR